MADDGRAHEEHQPDRRATQAPGPKPPPAQTRDPQTGDPQTGDANPYRVPPGSAHVGEDLPTEQGGPYRYGGSPDGYGQPGPYDAWPPPAYQAQPYPQGQPPYGYGPPAQGYGQPSYGHGPPAPGYGPPAYGYGYGYGQSAPFPSGYGAAAPQQTESMAVLALVLALAAVFVMPIAPALAAYVVAGRAKSSIAASYGARRGLGLVSAARWIATVHLLLLIGGLIMFGVVLSPLGVLL